MPPLTRGRTGQAYWRSLDELADTPEFREFVEHEFPSFSGELLASPSRRQFLKVMGASLALAGMTGCRWPKETIVPQAKRPPGRAPGVPVRYATAFELGGVATGLLVTSYDGRPVKIEGNELHPFSRGATDAIAQAGVLELYDPDRSRRVVRRDSAGDHEADWHAFERFAGPHFAELRQSQGAGLYVLSEASASPSLAEMRARLLAAFPQAKWVEYEPLSRDNEHEGARLAFGRRYRTHLHFEKADVVVSLDADFLLNHPTAVANTRDFARRRAGENGGMNRVYVIESDFTITGSKADHRYAVRSSAIVDLARKLLAEIGGGAEPAASRPTGLDHVRIDQIARDLTAHRARGLVVVGANQPPIVHAIGHAINSKLGNVGATVTYTDEPDADRPTHVDAIGELCERMSAGDVNTLLVLGGNPVYDAPADVEFDRGLSNVKTRIHLGVFDNETARRCDWHLPRAQYLESWADARAFDGTLSIVQPLIEPLYGGRTPIELLALAVGDETQSGYDIVRRTLRRQLSGAGDFESAWRKALHDGVVANTRWPDRTPQLAADVEASLAIGSAAAQDGFELVFTRHPGLHDGRFANNGWLQEMPDPLTKLTWGNAALISPRDAERLGARRDDVLRIEVGGKSLEIAAYVLPGHAPGAITLPVGFGRAAVAGKVAEGAGFDVYPLRTRQAMYIAVGAKVSRTGRTYKLATTQDHHSIQSAVGDAEIQKRIARLIREGTPEHPAGSHHEHQLPVVSLWKEHTYDEGHRWAMAIDLSKCTGCTACVVACQAENNIPVVGKEEVIVGREMHWIRIDRYFKGDPQDPAVEAVHQPLTCHHCENAPCEQVCPVAATVHDDEGLNVMVYNRCIGTRYCLNNCPYKVRRFNFFYNHHGPKHPRSEGKWAQKHLNEIEMMVHNPEVTVRSRGVMEKCTFCLQRINQAKITARNEWVQADPATRGEKYEIPDGTIVPACAQVCPAEAIIFGDLNQVGAKSKVAQAFEHERAYSILDAELNLKTRTRYLTKLRNSAHEGETAHT